MVQLWHCDTDRPYVLRDKVGVWFFWQKSQPYRLVGPIHKVALSPVLRCEVYTLGGSIRLFSGLLGDVPSSMRSYLHEVRVIF